MNLDSLDKWLQKNVTRTGETSPLPNKKKKKFFTRKKKTTNTNPVKQTTQESSKRRHKPEQKKTEFKRNKIRKPKNRSNSPEHSTENTQSKTKHHKNQKNHNNSHKKHPSHSNFIEQKDTKPVHKNKPTKKGPNKLRIIPLGGLNEVGKNMMAIEYGDDIVIIDMGLQFPEDDMLGVDYIVPDITYLQENQHKIRGVLITHAHLDHIGAIPFLGPKLQNPTFYGLRFTTGLIEQKIKEHKAAKSTKLVTVKNLQKIKLGVFTATFFRVNHSIPDACGIVIDTPEGKVIHTGDFKFDETPADGTPCDAAFMEQLGREGKVIALCADSTNATKPGHTMSEKVVGDTLDQIIGKTPGRLIIASFSSLIGRMQQIIDSAQRNNRQVFITGRSMIQNVQMSQKLGYLKFPKDLVKDLRKNTKAAQKPNALIITTGSQGESLAALTRMAMNIHPSVKINKNDTVVYSSSPIIGNEMAIVAVINEITRKGANVISHKVMDVHTTGHGQQEDLKEMINKTKPKFFVPIHGHYFMRHAHSLLAQECGIKSENCIIADNGSVVEAYQGKVSLSNEEVPNGYILLDNQNGGLSNIASHIISERQAMSLNGSITPIIVINKATQKSVRVYTESHGFIFMKQTKKVIADINREAKKAYDYYQQGKKGKIDIQKATTYIKGQVDRKVIRQLERRPLISPIIIEA